MSSQNQAINSNPYRRKRKILPWLLGIVGIVLIIAIILLSYFWTPASVSLTGYSGEPTRDVVSKELILVVNVHLKNAGMEPQSVTVYAHSLFTIIPSAGQLTTKERLSK